MPTLPLARPPTDGNLKLLAAHACSAYGNKIEPTLSLADEGWDIEGGLDTELMGAAATGRLDQIQALLYCPRPPANWMARLRRRFERPSAARERETRDFQESRARSMRVDMRNRDGMTALMFAARHGHVDCVQALLPHAGGYAKDNDGWTALMHAAAMGHESVVEALLGASNPNESTRRGETALLLAASRGHHACVGLLLPVSDANIQDGAGGTLLFRAVEANDVELVRMIVPFSDVRACRHNDGRTALIFAAANGDPAIVETLLPLSDPLAGDRHIGWNALLHAIASERLECIRVLAADNRAGEEAGAAYRRDAVSFALSRGHVAQQPGTTHARRLIEFAETILDVAPWPEVLAAVKRFGPEALPRSSARVEAAELAATVGLVGEASAAALLAPEATEQPPQQPARASVSARRL